MVSVSLVAYSGFNIFTNTMLHLAYLPITLSTSRPLPVYRLAEFYDSRCDEMSVRHASLYALSSVSYHCTLTGTLGGDDGAEG